MRESRDGSGSLTAQYFSRGQVDVSGGAGFGYNFELNHRGDIVGVSNATGVEITSINYDAFGRPRILAGGTISDFGFTGLYSHQRSGLSLAVFRAYSPALGRWINRDPIEEDGGINLFSYVQNDPINAVDRFGLVDDTTGLPPGSKVNPDGSITLPSGTVIPAGTTKNGVGCSREGLGDPAEGGCHMKKPDSGKPDECNHHHK